MDVKTVCLGMLTSGPATGYDLKKFFESSFGHFFPAGYGSIYPALSALAEQGLVQCEEIAQEGKPDRKLYSITESGKQTLAAALDNRTPTHKIRSEFLATLFFAHLMTDEQVDAILDNRCREVDTFIEIIEGMDFSNTSCWPPGARFVAGFGVAMAEACKKYIDDNRHRLTPEDNNNEVPSAQGWR